MTSASAHTTQSQKVVVAVRAEKKEISRKAVAWALTHIVRPGDCITLLAVLSDDTKSGVRKKWRLPKFNGDCGGSHRDKSPTDQIFEISQSCSQMVLQFHDQNQVGVRIKVVSGSPVGVVASEAKKAGANWVVLDRHLKEEEKQCMEELHCNIIVIKRSQARALRVSMGSSDDIQPFSTSPSIWKVDSEDLMDNMIKHPTPVTSPENLKTCLAKTTTETSSISSSDVEVSSVFVYEQNPLFEKQNKERARSLHERVNSSDSFTSSGTEGEGVGFLATKPMSIKTKSNKGGVYWIPQNHIVKNEKITKTDTSATLIEKFVQIDREARVLELRLDRTKHIGHVFNSDVRDVVSLSRSSSAPPPLCSLCQNKAPVFGKPPRWFDYRELEEATDGFSNANSLAEGGFGSVHRGILRDGQVIAVKQLHVNGSLGDAEFCREVGVLSCAQHRNVVTLIGFCIEGKKRILVYEYVCNGSLDYHLHGRREILDWQSRMKIAIGTARGLRYLHEDCRVGCIVHRDVRPNNILLTHDFEPLVGDFGVSKWRPELELDLGEAHATSSFRYLAPQYLEHAKMTEKADVFAFGLVLRELITGRKVADIAYPNRHQFLAKWYSHLRALDQQGQTTAINRNLVDPCLDPDKLQNCSHQLQAMARAASLCLRQDPQSRPPMSKVLRTIEGGNTVFSPTHPLDIGNRSGRLSGLSSSERIIPMHTRKLSQ